MKLLFWAYFFVGCVPYIFSPAVLSAHIRGIGNRGDYILDRDVSCDHDDRGSIVNLYLLFVWP